MSKLTESERKQARELCEKAGNDELRCACGVRLTKCGGWSSNTPGVSYRMGTYYHCVNCGAEYRSTDGVQGVVQTGPGERSISVDLTLRLLDALDDADRELKGSQDRETLAFAEHEKDHAAREGLERQLSTIETILGEAIGTHEDYRKGAGVALAEGVCRLVRYLEESHLLACEERDEAKRQSKIDEEQMVDAQDMAVKADKRASKAEGERDEARRMYCTEVARGESFDQDQSCSLGPARNRSARQVAVDEWPSEASKLFPDGEVEHG